MADFVETLGPAFFAHRLRRLSEELVEGCGDWFAAVGVTAPPRAASCLLLLRARGLMSVQEIAEALRLTPVHVASYTREMTRMTLVRVEPDPVDRRRRVVFLNPSGRQEAERIAGIVRMMATAYSGLFTEAGIDAFKSIGALEDALRAVPLTARLQAAAEGRPVQAPLREDL